MENNFGEYLKQIRELRGLTASKLSELSKVSTAYISRLENGQRNPSLRIIKKLAPHLGVSSAELLLRTNLVGKDDTILIDDKEMKNILLNMTEGKKELFSAINDLSDETLFLIADVVNRIKDEMK